VNNNAACYRLLNQQVYLKYLLDLEEFMRYKVNIKKTEEGYSIWVPGLPGCWSQGQTEEESLENIKDAIQDYLETVDELSKDKESRYVEVGDNA
jgi:Uncharacterized conserved protein